MAGNGVHLNYNSCLLLKAAIDSGITSPAELAVLMGNAHVETWGFSTLHEKMNYRSAEALIGAVGSADDRFSMKEIEHAVSSKDPRQIATILYENRKDLNNTQPGDGWRFHGRGFFQYTGRYNYEKYGRALGVDLVGNPDMAAEPEMAAELAVAYWLHRVPVSKRENLREAALIINGGENGMEARVAASREWSSVIDVQLIQQIQSGAIKPELFPAGDSRAKELPASPVVHPGQVHLNHSPVHSHASREDALGDEAKDLQKQLNRLGYRDPHGHPLTTDGAFGHNTEYAIKSFQRAHQLHVDGTVGKDTRAALVDAQYGPLLSEATHPAHPLYMQVLHGIQKLPHDTHRGAEEQLNLAVALTISAHVGGLKQIDHVVPGTDGVNLFAVQGAMEDPAHRRVHVGRVQAAAQTVEHSTLALQQGLSMQQQQPANSHPLMQPVMEQRGVVMGIRP
jgi:putative chitinase